MEDGERLKALITTAFAAVERPGDWALVDSLEGEEPGLLVRESSGKGEWRDLDGAFLDQAPAGFASALSFFSDEAYRYFLPAYLIADLDGELDRVDPVVGLTRGLDDTAGDQKVNPRRYGDRTWEDAARHRLSVFTRDEARAILAYLEWRAEQDEIERGRIQQAIKNYWAGYAG